MTVKITGMQIKRGRPNRGGSRIMATFDFHTTDLGFKGCCLTLNPAGKWRVWTPMIDPGTQSAKERKILQVCVYWRSGGTLEQQVLDAALAMFHLLDDGDDPLAPWEPREHPEPSSEPEDREGLMRALGGA